MEHEAMAASDSDAAQRTGAPEPDTFRGVAVSKGTSAAERAARVGAARARRRTFLFFCALLAMFVAPTASHHVRAAKLLVTFSDPKAKTSAVEEITTFEVPASGETPARTVKARVYAPPGASKSTPAVVLVHGVQYLGIEEPRLQRFARSLVTAGLVVMTPQVDELADYHVSPRSIETVGAAIETLRARRGQTKVGLLGTSFGGGIALLTAADARFADHVSFVVGVGAHDDLARVSGFFATNTIVDAEGTSRSLRAHEYGATVLVYTHAADFFPAEDVPAARDALRLWLWEKREPARAAAARLSPESKSKVERLFEAKIDTVRDELLAEIERRRSDMATVSPHGRLGGLRARVYLLHGEGDSVIPATETLWLAKDVPRAALREVLVSPAIQHVELKEPSLADQWSLVHFMSEIIAETSRGT